MYSEGHTGGDPRGDERRSAHPHAWWSADDADRHLDRAVGRAAGLVTLVVEEAGLVLARVEHEPLDEVVRAAGRRDLAVLHDRVEDAVVRAAHLALGRVVRDVAVRPSLLDDVGDPGEGVAGLRPGAAGLADDGVEDLAPGGAGGDRLDRGLGRRVDVLLLATEDAILDVAERGAEGHAVPPVCSADVAVTPVLAI